MVIDRWAEVAVGAVCEKITKGTTPTTLGYSFAERGVPFLRAQNLVGKHVSVETDPMYISLETHAALRRSVIKPNDVLMAIAGTIGRVSMVQAELPIANCNQAVALLRPLEEILPAFLLQALRSQPVLEQIRCSKVTGVISNLSLGVIRKLKIPLPPLEEQRRIVEILDAAQALIDQRKEQLGLMDQLVQSLFYEMFGDPVTNPRGWEKGAISDLSEKTQYGTSKKASMTEGNWPVLRMNNITYNGTWDFTKMKYVDLEPREEAKHLVRSGDILFNRTNSRELVGKTAVYKREKPMAYAGYLIKVITNERAAPEYISAYLNCSRGKAVLLNMAKSIVGMANINAKELQKIRILIPPIELQTQFAERVKAIEVQKAAMAASLVELETTFQALMQRAFKGELTG